MNHGHTGNDSAPLSLADRYYAAFNSRDHDAWLDTLDDDVEIVVDAGVMRGRTAALAYLTGILQAYPGVTVAARRVVAVSRDAVVSEFHLANPQAAPATAPPAPTEPVVPWRLDGITCEVLRLRGDRLISLHSYYSPTPTDRTPTAEVPSRAEAARIAHRQAALARVATQVAGGASERDLVPVINKVIAEFAGVDVSLMLRFETGDTAVLLAASGSADDLAAVGRRLPLDEDVRAVRDGRRALRFGSRGWPLREPADASTAGKNLRWCVGVPITLHGTVWGVVLLGSARDEPFADDIEEGIAAFTQLVSTALANAQANDELLTLADQQAALRRVAELAARDAPVGEVLHVVAKEASVFVGVDFGMVLRYEDAQGGNQIVALYGAPDNFSVGMRAPGTGDGALHRVWRTGHPARVQDLGQMSGLWPTMALAHGFTTSAGVPIVLRGALWGALIVVGGDEFPARIEEQLTHFAELAGTAVSAADARQELRALADEQAALRRVAELTAHEASAEKVLEAVAAEASMLAGVDFTTLLRYEPDGSTVMVALDGAPEGITVGMRAPGTGDGAVQRVWRTGRPASIDNLAEMSGVWPQLAHRYGFKASVAVPIEIHGRLWGALVTLGRREPFPRSIVGHVSNFADLAGAAVAAADAREELTLLADEQAAVRRVAELVARDTSLDQIFDAVAVEASSLLGNLHSSLLRYDDDRCVVVASCNGPARPGQPVLIDTAVVPRVVLANPDAGRVAVPVTVEGQVWGALAVTSPNPPLPADLEDRLNPFAELAAVAIVNADNKSKLTASRARVVATADETRRRVQRDVHDGAQQRLVHTIIALKMARDAVLAGKPPIDLLEEALSNAERASKELRDIVRGILPASLTRGGLRSGLESLLADLALPVTLRVSVPRLSARIETTAYFIVAEAMTNVVKHARAGGAAVDVTVRTGTLVVEVSDDGVGGADPQRGSGLTGLLDRVEAGNGTLTFTSRPGAGTTVLATLPLEPAAVLAAH